MTDIEKVNYMRIVINLAIDNVMKGFSPFASIVINGNDIMGVGVNQVHHLHDPTAHAEIMAIRDACSKINYHKLSGATIFASSEPCPMCLTAILWADIKTLYYGCSIDDTRQMGYDDQKFYEQFYIVRDRRIIFSEQILKNEAIVALIKRQEMLLGKEMSPIVC